MTQPVKWIGIGLIFCAGFLVGKGFWVWPTVILLVGLVILSVGYRLIIGMDLATRGYEVRKDRNNDS